MPTPVAFRPEHAPAPRRLLKKPIHGLFFADGNLVNSDDGLITAKIRGSGKQPYRGRVVAEARALVNRFLSAAAG